MLYKDPEKRAIFYQENKERLSEENRIYREKNKDRIKASRKKYRRENREKIREQKKISHLKHKEKNNERSRRRYQENHEEAKLKQREYRLKNRIEVNESLRRLYENRSSVQFRMEAWCQFDGCEIDNRYMLCEHHLFPGDKKTSVVLCFNHHQLIDHYKEGFYESRLNKARFRK